MKHNIQARETRSESHGSKGNTLFNLNLYVVIGSISQARPPNLEGGFSPAGEVDPAKQSSTIRVYKQKGL